MTADSYIDELKNKLEGMRDEAGNLSDDDLGSFDFASRLTELKTILASLTPLTELLNGALPEEELVELNKAVAESNKAMEAMEFDLQTLNELKGM